MLGGKELGEKDCPPQRLRYKNMEQRGFLKASLELRECVDSLRELIAVGP